MVEIIEAESCIRRTNIWLGVSMGAILPIKMAYEHIQPLYTVLIVTLVGDHHPRLAFYRKNLFFRRALVLE